MSKKTVLSAGLAVKAILDEALEGKGCPVFPVQDLYDDMELPYASYERLGLTAVQTKGGAADTARVAVDVYAEDYAQGVELAEEVRDALDGVRGTAAGLAIQSITLDDASEDAIPAAKCYSQTLIFNIKIRSI